MRQRFTRASGRRLLPAAGSLLAAAFFLTACQAESQSAAPAGAMQAPPTKVDVVTIQAQPFELTEQSSGRVTAFRSAEVRPQITGIIEERLFEEGSKVNEGDLLYQVDPATYDAALASAKANLAVAQATARNALNRAERYRDLIKKNAISKQDADDAEAAWRQAEAQIEAARAAVQAAQINVDYTRITAPISGFISRSSVTEGALVSAGQATALATIRQLSPIYVDIKRSASATILTRGREGRIPVTLELEDGSTFTETGTLQFSETSVDESTGMVTARARFDNTDGTLLPGMFVRANIIAEVIDNAILAPQQAVSRQPDGSTLVMTVDENNTVQPRPITVSRTIGDQWLVTDGLSNGDRVIVAGLQKVKPGATVEPIDANADNAGNPE
ncbi:efflux RND transporter periplasmic adaptor subunit [Granulosicoccaceae sp. 1_MG-2023]|nr:efflux RND transporter periplasmic adaptor subunit [Granulosicoccaceae sp. 1_MG-2023]